MTDGFGDIGYKQHAPLFGGFSGSDLVEKPADELLAKLGWATGSLFGEFAHGASAEGRASKRNAILPNRLKVALRRLNPALPHSAHAAAEGEREGRRPGDDPAGIDLLPAIYVPELWGDKVERTYRFVFEHFGSAPLTV